MRADDLVPLVAPEEDEAGTRYAQGRVVSWDQQTGRNRIAVAGTELENIPILNTGETVALRVGHIVGLLRWKSQWFILGRIVVPGGPDFASASIAFDSSFATANGFAGGNSLTVLTTWLWVPKWATEAVLICNAMLTMNNTTPNLSNIDAQVYAQVDNGEQLFSQGLYSAAPSAYWAALSPSDSNKLKVGGASKVTVGLKTRTNWPAHVDNSASINLTAIFRSTA